MRSFVSTTWYGEGRSDVETVLSMMVDLDLDGIELGSTHAWRPDLEDCVRKCWTDSALVHNYFPSGKDEGNYDMTDLFEAAVAAGEDTTAFPVHEYWLYVGRIDDLEKANKEFKGVFGT